MSRILVVDDEPHIRELMRRWLEGAGYTVVTADGGNAALAMVDEEEFALVITDIIMPDREGISTVSEMRRKIPDLKIIAMSGAGLDGGHTYLEAASLVGADAVITKPFESAEVLEAVQEILDGE